MGTKLLKEEKKVKGKDGKQRYGSIFPTHRKPKKDNHKCHRRTFHEGLRSDTGDTGDWERLPVGTSLQKLRLENTKVGCCPIYILSLERS